MIAGEDAKAPRKQRQTLVQAEFHRKVGDGFVFIERALLAVGWIQNPVLKLVLNALNVGQIAVVPGQLFKAPLGNLGQKSDRVATGLHPARRINPAKQLDGVFFPAPPHIARERFKKCEIRRNIGMHLESLKIFHNKVSLKQQVINEQTAR